MPELPELPDGYYWRIGPEIAKTFIDMSYVTYPTGNYGIFLMKRFPRMTRQWSWKKLWWTDVVEYRNEVIVSHVQAPETFPANDYDVRMLAKDLVKKFEHRRKLEGMTGTYGRPD